MIGILCRKAEREVVGEFFELFKTPWEFYREGRRYDVVISSLIDTPVVDARLLILFSSASTAWDDVVGVRVEPTRTEFAVDRATRLPLYRERACVVRRGQPVLLDETRSRAMAIRVVNAEDGVLRVGYNLFDEVRFLLTQGQPVENALYPTLELHIALLRNWILEAGIPLVEIPPVPWGHPLMACLTHDVDFVSVRKHKWDVTLVGFLGRALLGSTWGVVRGRYPLRRALRNYAAVLALPFVHLGWARDFWDQFEGYAELEGDLTSTFFLIPYRDRTGEQVPGEGVARRAVAYDIDDVRDQVGALRRRGCEVGVHGIDAWHSPEQGREELERIAGRADGGEVGIRMHWLCFDDASPSALEDAGFAYDATFGYNEAVGFRGGTTQVFRPEGAQQLLELPLHVADTALFFPRRMALTEAQARELCRRVLDAVEAGGGVVTLLWHMRSLGPERLWGDFYAGLIGELRRRGAWFGTAKEVVDWFRLRRSVTFERSDLDGELRLRLARPNIEAGGAGLCLRFHTPAQGASQPQSYLDVPLTQELPVEIPLPLPRGGAL